MHSAQLFPIVMVGACPQGRCTEKRAKAVESTEDVQPALVLYYLVTSHFRISLSRYMYGTQGGLIGRGEGVGGGGRELAQSSSPLKRCCRS